MKIVSKYKDFYDSFGFILGKPDESITYVRIPMQIDKDDNKYKSIIKEIHDYGHLYFHTYGFKEDYVAWLESIVCGFYPYIYICPFYVIVHKITRNTYVPIGLNPIPVAEEYVHDKKSWDKIYNKVQSKFDEYCKKNGLREKLHIDKLYDRNNRWYTPKFEFEKQSWKIENPDIFRKLESPTFMYANESDDIAQYLDGNAGLTINPIFVKQKFDVLGSNRSRITNEQNVYIDIENFLWETKKEPECLPDNKTKIINAGFDLKTSFRNM